jgi:hypothetical protein
MRVFYAAFAEWSKEAGITLVQQERSVRQNLEHLGYEFKPSNKGKKMVGLGLKGSRTL